MAFNFIYTWNLKNKINKQNRNSLMDTENILMIARWELVEGLDEKGEGIEKYRLVVTKWSQGREVQQKGYSQ